MIRQHYSLFSLAALFSANLLWKSNCFPTSFIKSFSKYAHSPSKFEIYSDTTSSPTARDLTGYSLWVKFTGFGAEDMNFGLELLPGFEATFSRGIESESPGFWRVIKYEDGKETLEVTHPSK